MRHSASSNPSQGRSPNAVSIAFPSGWRHARLFAAPAGILAIIAAVASCTRFASAAELAPAVDPQVAHARKLWLTGRYQESERAARALLPSSSNAVAILSRSLAERGQSFAAIEVLKDELQRRRGAPSPHIQAELAWRRFSFGEYESSQQAVSAALMHDPQHAQALWTSAELHRVHGRLEEAETDYAKLISRLELAGESPNAEDALWIARAVIQQARWQRKGRRFKLVVAKLLPRIYQLDESYWPARAFAAELFAEKFNQPQAEAELDRVLSINPSAPAAHALRGRLAVRRYDQPRTKVAIERLRRLNPQSPAAKRLEAQIELQHWNYQTAAELLEQALHANPHDEVTLGMLAAAQWGGAGLHRKPPAVVSKLCDRVETLNPHCGRFYETLAIEINAMQKYPYAVQHFEESIRRHPGRIGPRGRLGLLLMRLGREQEATVLLSESFENDPYNVRVKNMLEVLDLLKDYALLETEHFVIRFDRGADGVLAEHAAQYLEEHVYPSLTKELGFTPPDKSLIEIFNNRGSTSGHSWFSARMSGLPFVGTVGACAGKMVAITSPSSVKQNYNWARVLRHEFVHVVNLQQTHFHIPHWFTEALAVRLEQAPRPTQWDEILARRHASDSLFTLSNINSGFIRPKNSDDWTLAYCQSELYAEYFVKQYGDQALAKLIAAYAENQSTAAALQNALGESLDSVERGYREYVDAIVSKIHIVKRLAPPLEDLLVEAERHPENADIHGQVALAQLKKNRKPAARESALAALKLKSNHPVGQFVMARLELSIGDKESALKRLEDAYDAESPNEDVLVLLAALRLQAGRYAEAAELFQAGAAAFPHPTRWLKQLARAHLKSGNEQALYGALSELAEREGDNLLYRRKLIQLAKSAKNYADILKWSNQSLQIDVLDAEHHAQRGLALAALNRPKQAVPPLETAVRLDPNQPGWQLGLAKAAQAAGNRDLAQKVIRRLAADSPDFPGVQETLKELMND